MGDSAGWVYEGAFGEGGQGEGCVVEGAELGRVGRGAGDWGVGGEYPQPTNSPTQLVTDHVVTEKKQSTMQSETPDIWDILSCLKRGLHTLPRNNQISDFKIVLVQK